MSRTTTRSFLFVLIATTIACDKVALLAPTGSTVTLSISSTSVASNGTAAVIAAVIESSGTPVHNGTEVTFQASVGQVDPAVVRTEGGIARTTFRANGASGTAKITAFSGGARATDVEVLVGGAAASTVNVRTDPTSVPQNGGTVQVIATVRDVSGNPLPNAQVVFATDNGTLGANSGLTDSNGDARTSLTTNRASRVSASVAGKEGFANVTVVNAPTIAITAPQNANAGVPVTFTITPGAATNGNPIQNVTFDPGDGSAVRNLGNATNPQSIQHTYTRADNYTARATVTDTAGQRGESSAAVSVQRATINLTLSSSPQTANVNEPVTFTVTSSASANGPPIRSVVVTFPDGQSQTVGPGTQTVVRSFPSPGNYTVRARATDTADSTQETTTSVTIRARAPVEVTVDAASADPNFTHTCVPTTGYPKTCTFTPTGFGGALATTARVQFTATATSATDPIVSYVWSFGDGSGDASGRNTDHVFQRFQTYNVTVTVTTASGATGSGRVTITIQ